MDRPRNPARYVGEVIAERRSRLCVLSNVVHPPEVRHARHDHSQPIFSLTLDGSCVERSEAAQIDFEPRATFYYPPGVRHANIVGPAGWRVFNIALPNEWLAAMRARDVRLDEPCRRDVEFGTLMRTIRSEASMADAASLVAIEGLLLELGAACMRREAPLGSSDWVERVALRLADDLLAVPTVGELARDFSVHPAHLSRAFRARFQCTIGEFVRNLRLDRSVRELRSGTLPIGEISSELGFHDASHFARAFRTRFGMTPLQYRRARNATARRSSSS